MKRTQLLYLSSEDNDYATNPNDPSRFIKHMNDIINIDRSVEKAFITVRYADLPQLKIIVNDTNDSIIINSVDEVTIPSGPYINETTFLGSVLTALNNYLGVGSVNGVYTPGLGYTFENTGNTVLTFNFPNSSARDLLGFRDTIGLTPGTNASSQVLPFPATTRGINICTNLNLSNTYSSRKNGRSDVLEVFPVNPSGSSTFTNTNTVFRSELKNDTINTIELWLRDGRGNVILLDEFQYWTVGILVQIEPIKIKE